MDVPLWAWFGVLCLILVMLAADLVAHRHAHVVSVREAATWSGVWVAVGLAFGGVIWWQYGGDLGSQYLAGYVIEKSLAVDNVFVFALLFAAFAVPRQYQHRILFYGVVGALVFRGVLIALGSVLLASFAWVLYVFGALLVVTGVRMARSRGQHKDPREGRAYRLFTRIVPTTDVYHGARFWIRSGGRRVATPLLVVLVLVEVTDVVFAVDSIPAVFAVTQEPFLVLTSNAFAILGLRAMYFLLADLMHRFVHLTLGLAMVLVWVGVKMLLVEVWKVPTLLSLGVVVTILAVAVITSLRATRTADVDLTDVAGAEAPVPRTIPTSPQASPTDDVVTSPGGTR